MTCEYKDYDKYGPRLFSGDWFILGRTVRVVLVP